MTVDRETRDDLRRVQDLLRREVPDGDPGQIFARALKLLLRDAERKAFAATEQPGRPRILIPRTRTIPAHVRRAVWIRDGGRCAFVGRRGRCSECSFLEFHHIVPYERGGEPTVENIALRCRAHNQYEAELVYGREAIQRRRKRTRPEPGESVPEQISSVMKSGEARAKMTT